MKLYTAKELAKILHLHVNTIYRLGAEGKLKTLKIGGSTRYILPEGKE